MNKELKILYSAHFVNILADYLLIPIFALLVIEASSKVQLVGILFAVQYITSSFVSLFIIKMKDKSNLDGLLLTLCYFIKGFGWFLLIFIRTIPILVLVQILMGIALGIGGPSFGSLISGHLDKNKHLAEWGDLMLIQNVAIGTGSILAGFTLAKFGFSTLFIMMAAFEFTAFLICHYLLKSKIS